MAVNTIDYRPTLGTTENTDRNPSPLVWGDCPWNELVEGITSGVYFWDDFTSFPITVATTEGNWGQYAQFSSTGGTITAGTGQGGEAIFASDGDSEGASIRTLSTPFKLIRTAKKFWFEMRIKTSTIADTKHEFFGGLFENAALTAAIPITDTAALLADKNIVGFYRTESDGDAISTAYKADSVTMVTVAAIAAVPVADTYLKLGMTFEPDISPDIADPTLTSANKWILRFYKNGVKLADYKQIPSAAGTDFPNDVGLGLAFAVRNATGTTPGNTTIDWWRAAQLI